MSEDYTKGRKFVLKLTGMCGRGISFLLPLQETVLCPIDRDDYCHQKAGPLPALFASWELQVFEDGRCLGILHTFNLNIFIWGITFLNNPGK